MTFDTVGTETPVCSAMSAIVVELPLRRFRASTGEVIARV
jgi:hypothetical protein